jgi:hypothetical protein
MIELRKAQKTVSLSRWYSQELWTWRWWLDVAMIILPLYIWWKVVDRKRIYEIVSYGLLINIMASYLDIIGSEYALWMYPVRVLPSMPFLFPVDSVVIPVTFMIVYQKYPKWKGYIITAVIVSLVFSFAAEPLLVWANLYRMVTWHYIYSFPIYVAIAVTGKWMIGWFRSKSIKAGRG